MQSCNDGPYEPTEREISHRPVDLGTDAVPSLFDDSLDGAANRFKEEYRDFEAVRAFLEEMREWYDYLFSALSRFQEDPDLDPAEHEFGVFIAGIEFACWELNDAIVEAGLEPLGSGYVEAGLEPLGSFGFEVSS